MLTCVVVGGVTTLNFRLVRYLQILTFALVCLIDGGLKSLVKLNKMRNEGGTLGGRGWGLENQRNLIRSDGGLENQKKYSVTFSSYCYTFYKGT